MLDFTLQRLAILSALEQKHFWFTARHQLVLSLIRKFNNVPARWVADIGCGTGYNLYSWTALSKRVIGIDRLLSFSPYSFEYTDQIHRLNADVGAIPLTDASIDLAVALDVLEHVDDRQMLAELHRIIDPQGLLVVTVPAMMWLWSYRDQQAGHRRRYNRNNLAKKIQEAGFTILHINYSQFLLFPAVVVTRLIPFQKLMHAYEEKPGVIVNNLFSLVSRMEILMATWGLKFPWGSSLILIAEKNVAAV